MSQSYKYAWCLPLLVFLMGWPNHQLRPVMNHRDISGHHRSLLHVHPCWPRLPLFLLQDWYCVAHAMQSRESSPSAQQLHPGENVEVRRDYRVDKVRLSEDVYYNLGHFCAKYRRQSFLQFHCRLSHNVLHALSNESLLVWNVIFILFWGDFSTGSGIMLSFSL